MNNNSKKRFNQAKRNNAKGNSVSLFEVPIVITGGQKSHYNKTYNFESQPRLSKNGKGKVAGQAHLSKKEIEQKENEEAIVLETQKIEKEVKSLTAPIV